MGVRRAWVCVGAMVSGLALITTAVVIAAGQVPDGFGTLRPTGSAAPNAPAGTTVLPLTHVPERLVLPGLDVSAAVIPVLVRADGSLAVPTDPRQVGWWVGGSHPGADAGTTLIAGHVDDLRLGRGALFRLTSLHVGDPVHLDTSAGRHTYRVVARRDYPKQRLPADLTDRHGPARLVLVTCGGSFDPDHGYADNVVVYAEPVTG